MKSIRIFSFAILAVVSSMSFSFAANTKSIEINNRDYSFTAVECSTKAVRNNNNGKFRLSIDFIKNGDVRFQTLVYANYLENLFKEGTALGNRYHEICNGFFGSSYCMQANKDRMTVKWTDMSARGKTFAGKGYIQISRQLDYGQDLYYPTQKIYFQCDGRNSISYGEENDSDDNADNGNNDTNRGSVVNSYNTNNYNTNNYYNNYNYYQNTDNNQCRRNPDCAAGYSCANGGCVKDPIVGNCSKEGERTNGTVAPEYQIYCCAGLEGFFPENIAPGAGPICFNPNRGTPSCKYIGTSSEGIYYSNGDLLEKGICHQTCTRDSQCKNGYSCTNGTCQKNEDITICAKEGEFSSSKYTCCAGLDGYTNVKINAAGNGPICYDSRKGVPSCQKIGTIAEGLYYNSIRLLKLIDCGDKVVENECTRDSDCNTGYLCNHGSCTKKIDDTTSCVKVGPTTDRTCCAGSTLTRAGTRTNQSRYCIIRNVNKNQHREDTTSLYDSVTTTRNSRD